MQTPLSNCLLFALWMCITRRKRSYISTRWSDFYFGPHFLWTKRYRSGRFVMLSLVPQGRNPDGSYTGKPAPKFKRKCPPFLFRGVLVRGDETQDIGKRKTT